ncbi:MAG: ATP-binding protein [Cellulosilyticaceae bacterium]
MLRKIVHINEEKCNGCGLCVTACHEGALALVNGKASLISDIYCDGLGDCLPACPTNAIEISERDASAYNQEAVDLKLACACPGSHAKTIHKSAIKDTVQQSISVPSRLMQWPCQIKLVPPNAPYFEDADVLIAADCSAFAYGNFHQDFMQNKITLIGCPKLDTPSYEEKLSEIFAASNIKSITVVRMEVPCCSGLVKATEKALLKAKKILPYNIITLTTDGKILA